MVTVFAESPARVGQGAATVWEIDPSESRVEFTIGKRLLLFNLTVNGRFGIRVVDVVANGRGRGHERRR